MLGPAIPNKIGQLAVAVGAAVIGEAPERGLPGIGLGAGDLLGEVHAFQPRPLGGELFQRVEIEPAVRGDAQRAVRGADVADPAGQASCVDPGDAGQVVRLQPVVEMPLGAVVGGVGDVGPQHAAEGGRAAGLVVADIGADIAHMREREGDDLPGIGRIGHDLLVAGHRCVEHHLANLGHLGPETAPEDRRPIGQDQNRRGVLRDGGCLGHAMSPDRAVPGPARAPSRQLVACGRGLAGGKLAG